MLFDMKPPQHQGIAAVIKSFFDMTHPKKMVAHHASQLFSYSSSFSLQSGRVYAICSHMIHISL